MKLADKIRARLKHKFPGVNLSNKRIDAIAAKLAKKLTDESEDADIDSALDDINDITPFAELAKDDDRLRTLQAKQQASKSDDDDDDQDDDEPAQPVKKTRKSKDEPPAWAQKLMQDLEALKGEKVKSSIAEKVKSHPKLKDIPEKFYRGRALPEKEEDIEAFVEQIETDHTEFMQEMIDQGLASSATKPILGAPNKDGISSETAAYIESRTSTEKAGGDLGGKKI